MLKIVFLHHPKILLVKTGRMWPPQILCFGKIDDASVGALLSCGISYWIFSSQYPLSFHSRTRGQFRSGECSYVFVLVLFL